MADISEVLLQSAQVINQSYAMLAKAQADQAELEVRRKNYEDLAQSREQALSFKEQAFQSEMELKRYQQQQKDLELSIREQNAQTGEGMLAVAQGRLELGKYKAEQDRLYKENNFNKGEYNALVDRLDKTLVGMKTGQPDLDKYLYAMRTPQLQNELPKLLEAQATGDLSSLGPEFKLAIAASNPSMLDKDKAASLASQVTRMLDFRKVQSDKIVEGYPERERNIIRGTNYLQESLQTADTSVQARMGDQDNANGNARQQAIRPAAGTTQSPMAPPTPQALVAQQTVDRTPPSAYSSPEGQAQTAEAWEKALYTLEQSGDRLGANALMNKMGQLSPDTANKVVEYHAARGSITGPTRRSK